MSDTNGAREGMSANQHVMPVPTSWQADGATLTRADGTQMKAVMVRFAHATGLTELYFDAEAAEHLGALIINLARVQLGKPPLNPGLIIAGPGDVPRQPFGPDRPRRP